jgi:hypothetical protein
MTTFTHVVPWSGLLAGMAGLAYGLWTDVGRGLYLRAALRHRARTSSRQHSAPPARVVHADRPR